MTARRRAAFTLIEVILTMCVLVIAASILIPSLQSMMGSYKLQGAVDSVRGAWAEARAAAIEQGRPYRFAFEPNGSFFRVAPDQEDYWGGSVPDRDPDGKGVVIQKALPSGVAFTKGDAPVQGGGSDSLKEQETPSGQWDTACVFLADGTARADLRIVFSLPGLRPKSLSLRAMTGATSTATEDK